MADREARIGNPQTSKLLPKRRFSADNDDLDVQLGCRLHGLFDVRRGTVVPAHGINVYSHSIHLCVTREDAQKGRQLHPPTPSARTRSFPSKTAKVWTPRRSGATLR